MIANNNQRKQPMPRITTAAALRSLADKILEMVKNAQAPDEPYIVNFDKVLDKIENND